MSWEEIIKIVPEDTLKGKRIDALIQWWKTRKFRAAAKKFMETQVSFALESARGSTMYSYVHEPKNMERDKQVFLQVMGNIFEEEYPKMGESAAIRESYVEGFYDGP